MTTNVKLKEAFEVESKYGAFFTGGNVEWLSEDTLLCQKEYSLQFLDVETGTVTQTIGEESSEDSDFIHTFTSNSNSVITAHKSGLLKLWQYDGALIKVWKSIHKGPISKMCMDGNSCLATEENNRLATDEHSRVATDGNSRVATDGNSRLVTYNSRLATGGSDGIVRLWDIEHQACTHSLRGCQGVISAVIFHPRENILFAAGDDTKIHSWDLSNSQILNTYTGHFSKITSICFHPETNHIISSGRDKVIILWDPIRAVPIKTVPTFESIESVVVLPEKIKTPAGKFTDGIFVASAGEKGVIRIWDLENNKELYKQDNSLAPPAPEEGGLAIVKLMFNKKKKQFCVVTVDHNILFHSLKSFVCIKQFVGFSDEILDVCFVGNNDSHLAVATNSNDIKLYEFNSMSCTLLQGHKDIVLSLNKTAANPNLLISSAKDNTIRLWEVNNTNNAVCIGIGSRHTGSVGSVALSQTSVKFAVSVSQDTCLKLWEIPKNSTENQSLDCLRTEIAHQKDINCVTVSPNDKIIATGSQDKTCKLWNENLELLGALRGHKRGIWSVRFSPVDQIVITSSADCTVKLWSVAELNCLKTLQGHESSVLKLEFLSNGMQILTAGADGLLKLFSVKTSECCLTLDQHEGRVWTLAVKSDESVVISGGSDSLLVKWKDVTIEQRLQKLKEQEELALEEQKLSNLVHNNELLKALKLALRLNRPHQTLKIVEGVIKKGDTGLADTIAELDNEQKEILMKNAISWNTNSRNCQSAQLVLNILLNELQGGKFRPQGLSNLVESSLPYTERHFKRLTQLLQDLYFINYTVNCMQPHAKNS